MLLFLKVHKENDAVVNEVVASAHIENYAMKLFLYADKSDRAGNFTKSVVKSFYSAGILFDVMQCFGEVTPEVGLSLVSMVSMFNVLLTIGCSLQKVCKNEGCLHSQLSEEWRGEQFAKTTKAISKLHRRRLLVL